VLALPLGNTGELPLGRLPVPASRECYLDLTGRRGRLPSIPTGETVRRTHLLIPLVAVLGFLPGCRSVGDYVWVDSLPPSRRAVESDYVISSGDVISVRVWGQEGMSARARVRSDGKISLPFLNDVEAAGVTPTVLAKRLQTRLKEFLANPVVTISLEERKPLSVPVLGEVTRKGTYDLEPGSGILQALAAAGGLTEFASRDRIFVIRPNAAPSGAAAMRIRFDYESLVRTGRGSAFQLQAGDVIVVE
jgi:polysaccharide biosynthesis/export protein